MLYQQHQIWSHSRENEGDIAIEPNAQIQKRLMILNQVALALTTEPLGEPMTTWQVMSKASGERPVVMRGLTCGVLELSPACAASSLDLNSPRLAHEDR